MNFEFKTALSRFIFRTEGTIQVDSIVMMSGLVGLGLILFGTVGHGTNMLSADASAQMRVTVLNANFDASACPKGWINAHAANTGLAPADLETWYDRHSRDLSDATILAALDAHAQAPRDFRYRAPMRLAELQILMCVATQRELTLLSAAS